MSDTQNQKWKEQLEDGLKYLNMKKMLQMYEQEGKTAAQQKLPYAQFLLRIVEPEVSEKRQRSIRARIATAGFPTIKTIDTFDWNWPQEIDRAIVMKFMQLSFIEEHQNLIIIGMPGLGKSHIAASIAYHACLNGYSALWTTAIDVVNKLQAAGSEGKFLQKLDSFLRPKLLVIDEFGYLALDQKGADILFQLVAKRYERGSIILTTNLVFKFWTDVVHSASLASALADRLVHKGDVLFIKGESYRAKEQKKRDMLEKSLSPQG
jgi:DNA replication protein DnaC